MIVSLWVSCFKKWLASIFLSREAQLNLVSVTKRVEKRDVKILSEVLSVGITF